MATPLHNEVTLSSPEPLGSKLTPASLQGDDLPSPEHCVICLDQISDKAVALPCHHSQFDFSCLGTWLQRQQVCPLCKAEVTAISFTTGDRDENKTQVFYLPPPEHSQARRDERGITRTTLQDQRLRRTVYGRRNRNRASCGPPQGSKDTALDFRKQVYRHRSFSLHVGSNRISRYRNLTPASFAKDERLTARARVFIRRELQVFDFLNPNSVQSSTGSRTNDRRANNADFLLEYVVSILKSIDLKGSTGQAEELLKDFIGRDSARLFLHELEAWLRSPYENLKDWDRAVQYAAPPGTDGPGDGQAISHAPIDVRHSLGPAGHRMACRQSLGGFPTALCSEIGVRKRG